MQTVYTFAQAGELYIPRATRYVHLRYRDYVRPEDVGRVLVQWFRGPGEAKVRKWLSQEPQRTATLYRALANQGITYAEECKAAALGYSVDDVMWYSRATVEGLLPMALDSTFTGSSGQYESEGKRKHKPPSDGGDLLAMVIDVRHAIQKCKPWVLRAVVRHERGHPIYDSAVREIVAQLGGQSPYLRREDVA